MMPNVHNIAGEHRGEPGPQLDDWPIGETT